MIGKTNAGSGTQVFYLGTGTSFDVSNVPGYQNLTKDNFIVEAISASGYGSCYGSSGSPSSTIIKTYDSTSGKLTITGNSASDDKDGSSFHHVSYNIVIGVYLIKGKIKQL